MNRLGFLRRIRWLLFIVAIALLRIAHLIAWGPEFGGAGRMREIISIFLIYSLFGTGFLLTVASTRGLYRPENLHPTRSRHSLLLYSIAMVLFLTGLLWVNQWPAFPVDDASPTHLEAVHPDEPQGQQNIILITLDTVRRDHVGVFGYQRNTTPFLDRLAASGTVSARAVSTSPWTLPSHASMFTGLLPSEHGAVFATKNLDEAHGTIAEKLRHNGYKTIGITAGLYLDRIFGIAQGFQIYDDEVPGGYNWDLDLLSKLLPGVIAPQGKRRADQVLDLVFNKYEKELTAPFFLFLNFFDAHSRYQAPFRYSWKYRQWKGGRPWLVINESALFKSVNEFGVPLSAAKRDLITAQYDANLRFIDDSLHELFRWFRSRGLLEHTSVIVTADHGESLGERTILGHGLSLHREQIDVPFVLWRSRGSNEDEFIGPLDSRFVFNLILHEAGLGGDFSGQQAVSEVLPNQDVRLRATLRFGSAKRSVIQDCLKVMDGEDGRVHVYDSCLDTGEEHDMLPEERRRQAHLHGLLAKVKEKKTLEELAAKGGQTPKGELRDILKTLGYVD